MSSMGDGEMNDEDTERLLAIGRAVGKTTPKGNPDGTISFHHPIDDVFAEMVKTGMIEPIRKRGQE